MILIKNCLKVNRIPKVLYLTFEGAIHFETALLFRIGLMLLVIIYLQVVDATGEFSCLFQWKYQSA